MPNMDYPGPCPNCGAEGNCEHREYNDYGNENLDGVKSNQPGEDVEISPEKGNNANQQMGK